MYLINNQQYGWGDIKIFLFGQYTEGITKIEYKETLDKKLRYAAGNNPHSVQFGNAGVEGSIEVTQSVVIALNNSAKAKGYKSILYVNFDIVVVYEKDGIVTTDTIKLASIKELPLTMSQGDMEMKVNLPFIALGIV